VRLRSQTDPPLYPHEKELGYLKVELLRICVSLVSDRLLNRPSELAPMRLPAIVCLTFFLSTFVWGQPFKNLDDGHRFRSLVGHSAGVNHTGFKSLNDGGALFSFGNRIPTELYRTNQILLNGSGISLSDVNGDGQADIFATSISGANALLLNKGDWKFDDVTQSAGVGLDSVYSSGSVLADLDGDQDVDLLVSSLKSGTFLFNNDGHGVFTDITSQLGIQTGVGGMSITVGDYDLDGLLDFYVTNYRAAALMDVPNARMNLGVKGGKKIITDFNGRSVSEPDLVNRFYVDERGGIGEYGEQDSLFRNLGNLRFERVSFTAGSFLDAEGSPLTQAPFDWGLAAAFRDFNQDGLPDLYVCNDFDTPDRIWINQGDGRFRALRSDGLRQSSWFSMGIDFADVNRDGWDDFLTLDMLGSSHHARMTQLGDISPAQHLIKNPAARPQFLKTCLFMNQGDGGYSEVGQFAGLSATDWAWCPAFLDVDLDGWEDLLVTNGNERDGRNLDVAAVLKQLRAQNRMSDDRIFTERMRFPRLPTANQAYRNNRNGTFTELGETWGFAHHGVSHGLAFADLDNDGDLDAVVNHLNEPLGVYRNETSRPRVAVRLKGRAPNTAGVGARIVFRVGDHVQAQEIMAGGRYLSSDEPMRVFGIPEKSGNQSLEVHWPRGGTSHVSGVLPNRLYELAEPEVDGVHGKKSRGVISEERGWFEDVSHLVEFVHGRQDFDDLSRQPMLLRRYGDLGPGVAWYDIDSDGFDDLLVGSGRGGKLGIFRNNEGEAFAVYDRPPFDRPVSRDTTSILGVTLRSRDPAVLIGLSNYEDGLALGTTVVQNRFRSKVPVVVRGGDASSVGPMALSDWDQDGDLDLFVGGRFLVGRIPESPRSSLFLNNSGQFKRMEQDNESIAGIGMVSGAIFTDVDGDSDPDLVCALEWGSIQLFLNEKGQFRRATDEWGLSDYRGFWNGVHAGDFNADGKMDLVASNWGLNSPYQRYAKRPLELFSGDFDGNGQIDMLVGAFDSQLEQAVPIRQLGTLAAGLPAMNQLFTSHQSFAESSTAEILKGLKAKATSLSANWLQSTVFMNRGTKFDAKPLPAKAQWSPAFGVSVADFDGDGHEDLFLAQNYFGIRGDVSRYDAGQGLVLRGLGDGHFEELGSVESGIRIIGEQRGAAVADFDHDGRVDLAVGQNGLPLKLYRNQAAKPGLRVTLVGGGDNPTAVGAGLWLSGDGIRGPLREIRAGAGYLSQDAPTQVLTIAEGLPQELNVVWPDGKRAGYAIEAGDTELTIRYDGAIKRKSE
jgi:enediyne biosynthesis protein E4